jgi:hypothetical protein
MDNNYTQNKYLIWTCKCKEIYALEIKVVHRNKCKKVIGKTKTGKPIRCNTLFPSNTERKKLEREQFHVKHLEILEGEQ